MLIRIDHVMICVPDLRKGVDAYTRIGFDVRPGGEHTGQGTHNAIAFNEHEDIRFDVDPGAAQSFHKAGHVATGVDDPFGAAVLQAADELLEVCGDGWVFELGKKRAVEVG